MKTRLALVSLLIAICLTAVPVWSQRAPINPPGPVYIRGIVRNAATHEAMMYARVILEADKRGYITEASTDTQGRFEFQGLSHQAYSVRVRMMGFRGAQENTNTCDPAACQHVDLSLQSAEYIDFEMVPLPSSDAPAVPPGGPTAAINAAEAQIPEAARKEFDKGRSLVDEGKNLDEGIDHFKKAIALYPPYDQAYFRLGMVYMDRKDWKQAETSLSKATELNSRNGGAFLALGTAYAQDKNFTAAEQPLQRGLELNPDVAEAQCELSRTYWVLHKFPQSDERAQKCATLKPDYAPAHLMLGNLALAKRDKPAALREFREYVRLDPQGSFAAPAREQVSKLEKELTQAK